MMVHTATPVTHLISGAYPENLCLKVSNLDSTVGRNHDDKPEENVA